MPEKNKRPEMPPLIVSQPSSEESELGVLRAASELHDKIYNDKLTGLLRRDGLTKELRAMLESEEDAPKYLAVAFIDIDGFKLVNDILGYTEGDEALKQVALKLKTLFKRDEDVLASPTSRWGGDEFVVCAPFYSRKEDDKRKQIVSHVEFEQFVKKSIESMLIEDESLPDYIRNLKISVGAEVYNIDQITDDIDHALVAAQERMRNMKKNK